MATTLTITLQPKQREALRVSEETEVTLYGGAKGGGKSYLIRAREVKRRLQYPNSKGLIIRKTYPELLANHIRPFFREYPTVKDWYTKAEKTIYWPNGSTTEFSYLRTTDDVYTYQGREYEDISIDEITQHEEEVFKTLTSSLRTTSPDIKPSILLTGNPGGIGHQWVQRIFIDRKFNPEEKPQKFAFVAAKVYDNKALVDNDPAYLERLQALPEHLRRMYLEGDWHVYSGLAFSELSERVHVVKPFSLPPHTKFFSGFDWGYDHPYAFVLFAVTQDETVYVVTCASERNKRPDQIAAKIKSLISGKSHIYIYSGTDIWNESGRSSIYEQLRNEMGDRASFVRAYTKREQGVAEIRKYIAWEGTASGKPKLFFFENTLPVFNTVRSMQYDPKHPEDVLKVDADEYGYGGDDYYDAFRYGLMSRIYPANVERSIEPGTGEDLIREIKKRNETISRLKYWR
jgi:phage terminase large subunit